MDDPIYHPILAEPWTYEIVAFTWQSANEPDEAFLDVTLSRGAQIRRLRFVAPQDVHIEVYGGSHAAQCLDMVIYDIRDRGLEGLNVLVTEGGASSSPLILHARDVNDLDLRH